MTSSHSTQRDVGLLVIRLGAGLSLVVFHGYGKITAGPELWANLGGAMGHLGIHFAPVFWGFLSAAAESVGAGLLVLGVLFRPAAALVAINMFVAAMNHLNLPPDSPGHGWSGASHALELFAVALGLLITGSGRFALSSLWSKKRR